MLCRLRVLRCIAQENALGGGAHPVSNRSLRLLPLLRGQGPHRFSPNSTGTRNRRASLTRLVSAIILALAVVSRKSKHERSQIPRDTRFSSRGQAAPAPDGALPVRQQGNLPP